MIVGVSKENESPIENLGGLQRKIGVFNKKLGVYEGFAPGWGFPKRGVF